MKAIKLTLILLLVSTVSVFSQSTWRVDKSHSKVGFSVIHMVVSEVDGKFNKFDIQIISGENDFENSQINFSADINSIDTDNDRRDNHLKSDDFFNAEKFPQMTFVGKSFKKVDDKNYTLVGDLTIREVTKEVTLDVKYKGSIKDQRGNTRAGFYIEGEINRFDFNLKWDKLIEVGSLVVGENVKIVSKLELIKK